MVLQCGGLVCGLWGTVTLSLAGLDWTSEDGEDLSDSVVVAMDTANSIVDLISSLDDYQQVLIQLLQERNLEGYTPFMAAVVFKVPHTSTLHVPLPPCSPASSVQAFYMCPSLTLHFTFPLFSFLYIISLIFSPSSSPPSPPASHFSPLPTPPSSLCVQAYCTARILLDLADVTCKGQQEQLMSILYPPDSHPDDNPIFVLCRNDPCSFTWTGEEHIQQVRVR